MLWYCLYMGLLALVLFLWAIIAFREDEPGQRVSQGKRDRP